VSLCQQSGQKDVPLRYDILVMATGVTHSYFGHDEFSEFAPSLKGLADALHIRNKVLQAFEQAEAEEDPSRHRDLLTFVLVGAGPTGVELSAALAVLVRSTLKTEFRRIDPASCWLTWRLAFWALLLWNSLRQPNTG
jgi:NADH dehydrogenase